RAVRGAGRHTAGHARRDRDEHLPRLRPRRPPRRPRRRVRRNRQPLEGDLLAGSPEPQPDVRLSRGRGDLVTAGFFNSRWVPKPDHVSELDGGLPAGFRAAGAAAGLKRNGALDVGLLVSDAEETTSAARLTRSGV